MYVAVTCCFLAGWGLVGKGKAELISPDLLAADRASRVGNPAAGDVNTAS